MAITGNDLSSIDITDVIWVGTGGAEFTSIASAVASCSGGETILVAPGTYTETVTFAANNITVMGIGRPANTILTQANANVVDFGTTTGCSISYLKITLTAAATSDKNMITLGASGSASVRFCNSQVTTAAAAASLSTVGNVDAGTGVLAFSHGQVAYTNTAADAGAIKAAFRVGAGGRCKVNSVCDITITGSGASVAIATGYDTAGSGNINITDSVISVTDDTSGYVIGFGYMSGSGSDSEFMRNVIHVSDTSVGGNVASGLYNGGTRTTRSALNHMHVESTAGVAYSHVTTAAANTLNIHLDDIVAADGYSEGAGSTVNMVATEVDGEWTTTGTTHLSKGADVASANALPLVNDGNYFDVTGTTSITSMATLGIGTQIVLHFDGALTLTHNAADLILPGGANITTAAGDEAGFIEYASGDWRCVFYTVAANAPGAGGGDPSVNVETLSANKTIADGDPRYQYLDEGGSARDVTLPAAPSTSTLFVIRHNGVYSDTNYITIYDGATVIDYLSAGGFGTYVWDGSNWIAGANGTGQNGNLKLNVNMGYASRSFGGGAAVGHAANGQRYGAAFGFNTVASTDGTAVGSNANGGTSGTALGYGADSNSKSFASALGFYADAERYGETTISGDHLTVCKKATSIVQWNGTVAAAATPAFTELFLHGINPNRCTVLASSCIRFEIHVVATDTNDNGGAYTLVGCIKRDASNSTTLVGSVTTTVIAEDNSDWDVQVTADDANESIKFEFKGNDSDTDNYLTTINAVGYLTEVRR